MWADVSFPQHLQLDRRITLNQSGKRLLANRRLTASEIALLRLPTLRISSPLWIDQTYGLLLLSSRLRTVYDHQVQDRQHASRLLLLGLYLLKKLRHLWNKT